MNRILTLEYSELDVRRMPNTVSPSYATAEDNGYIDLLNERISEIFMTASKIIVKNPPLASFALKTAILQREAARRRLSFEKKGIHVPPFMILSVTSRCNLRCRGCYARPGHTEGAELSYNRLRSLVSEAEGLGTSVILLAGGEPLTRPEILDITRDFPGIIFPLFTNGLLMSDRILTEIEEQKNVIPVVSLEGHEADTDSRRGDGVYAGVQWAIREMKQRDIFFGSSIMMTRENVERVTDYQFIRELIGSGCKLFFFIEYVAVGEGDTSLILTDSQRKRIKVRLDSFRNKFPALFVGFPGDEEEFGGCLSAGRGFIHINPEGGLEPCPAAPYSDTSVKNKSLFEALKSNLLRQIRGNQEALRETSGGCALWDKREWMKSLISDGARGRLSVKI